MQNLISVIVTTYNQESTIGRTLDSILMQQCHIPVEIVIGEDCSTDGTLRVCQEYKDKYPDKILLLANNPNKGIVDNYFDCIFAAHGKYIADCAGDDYWIDPLKLEKEVNILEKNPEVGIVHTDWQRVEVPSLSSRERESKDNAEKLKIFPSPKPYTEEFITEGTALLEEILVPTERPLIHLCTSLYRTEWIRKAHDENLEFFRNKNYGCEDVQVAYFLAKMGKVAYLKDVTLNYSWGGESISNSVDYKRLFNFYKGAAQLTYDIAKRDNMLTQKVVSYLQQKIFELQMDALRIHNIDLRDEANSILKKWQIIPTNKIRLLNIIMSNSFTWKISLMFRSIFVAIK